MTAPKKTWFPDQHQLVIGDIKDSSYLHSLWVGLTAPALNLPLMLWYSVFMPMVRGLWFILMYFIFCALAGLRGRAHGFLVDMPTMTITIIDATVEDKKNEV